MHLGGFCYNWLLHLFVMLYASDVAQQHGKLDGHQARFTAKVTQVKDKIEHACVKHRFEYCQHMYILEIHKQLKAIMLHVAKIAAQEMSQCHQFEQNILHSKI